MPGSLDDRRRLAIARFLLGPDLSLLSPASRERALAAVLGDAPAEISRDEIKAWLAEHGTPETKAILDRVLQNQCDEAVRAHVALRAGLPLPASSIASLSDLPTDVPIGLADGLLADERIGEALSLQADMFFLDERPRPLPAATAAVSASFAAALERLRDEPRPDAVAQPLALLDRVLAAGDWPEALDGRLRQARAAIADAGEHERRMILERLAAGETAGAGNGRQTLEALASRVRSPEASREEQTRALDLLLAWPGAEVHAVLIEACVERWSRERAMPVLSLRYGLRVGPDWARWSAWLAKRTPVSGLSHALAAGVEPAELLLLLAQMADGPLSDLTEPLRDRCRSQARGVVAAYFLERWGDRLPPEEIRELRGEPVGSEAPGPESPAVEPALEAPMGLPARDADAAPSADVPAAVAVPPAPVAAIEPPYMPIVVESAPPAPPPPPSPAAEAWRGFLAENANLLAGIAMLLVGASLIAYFTWDRHWIFRYTILPGLFGAFTAGLAAIAGWLERSDRELEGTAAMLRGTAIALLPANCMSVSLLADDPMVTAKLVTVPAMAAFYLGLLVVGLRRWCGAVHPSLRDSLAYGLVFLNALVLVRPLARSLAQTRDFVSLDVLTAGFYAGFLVIAEVARRLTAGTVRREIADKPHVAWFAGGILVLTYVQVFVWAHAWERQLPAVTAYGPLLVLAGGLVFHVERRFREGAGKGAEAGEESFVGFALILAGLLGGFGSPTLRILCFVLAGLAWLYQAAFRSSVIHEYVGLLLLVLAGASVALLEPFPKVAAPVLGLAIALGVAALAAIAGRRGVARLGQAAFELEQALLTLTAVVAALTQWHFRSEPVYTAALLAAIAARLFVRAIRYQGSRDGLIGAMVAALALPYVGFADMHGRQFAGNTLVMGLACLSALWLSALRIARAPALLAMRSTVLFVYGAFAMAAMGARVFLERDFPPSLTWSIAFPEYAGPLLMLAVLVWTTYLSRSMLPMIGGLLIVVALLPAMKADFRAMFPALDWGTGYGSAVAGLLTVLVAFHARGLRALQDLGEGDRFFGEVPFPLQRRDHTLITTPLIAVALFLAVRVDTYTLLRNLQGGPPLKTAAAVVVSAAIWTLLGVWARRRATGAWGVGLGFVFLFVGLLVGWHQPGHALALEWPLLLTGLVLQAMELAYRRWVVPRHEWADTLLVRPTRVVLRWGSVVVASGLVVALFLGRDPESLRLLALFAGLQLVRSALERRETAEGSLGVALLLAVLLAETAPGPGPLIARLGWERSLWPLLAFTSAVSLLMLGLERRVDWFQRLAPILDPARAAAGLLITGLSLAALTTTVVEPRFARDQQVLLVANAALLARWAIPGPALLLALLGAYTCALDPVLMEAGDPAARLRILAAPISLALLALVVALASITQRYWAATMQRAWTSPLGVGELRTSIAPWLQWPAVAFAVGATLRHSLEPSLRGLAAEVPSPYLAATALLLLALSLPSAAVGWAGAIALTLGNIHAVRLAASDALRGYGLADLHLVALGVAATLLQATVARIVTRGPTRDFARQVTLAAAALMLALLSGNFASDPNLQDITAYRFIVSGAMGLLAGLSFRRAAVRPEPDELPYVGVAYAVYHVGVAMALWCLVLLVPAFRQPVAALAGLGLPALYFYVAAERFRGRLDPRAIRYARSSAVVTLVVLALYAARPLFQLALFPDAAVRTDHYHYNAPLVILLGLLLLRLQALEPRFAIAVVGGIALLVGLFFGLTGWALLSPFEVRYPAAWAAVAIAHAFTWLSRRRGPYRAALQRLGAIDDATWTRLAQVWHLAAFIGALEVGLLAAVHPDAARFGRGALLGAVASILLQGSWARSAVTVVTAAGLALGLGEAVAQPSLLSEIGLLVVAVAAARTAPGAFALIAWLAVYLLAHHPALAVMQDVHDRWALLTSPWRLSALALGLALSVEAARRRSPEAAEATPGTGWAGGRSLHLWLGLPAAALAVVAAALHAAQGEPRVPSIQLWTAYLASAAHAVLALSPATAWLAWSAAALLALGNVHVIQAFGAETLRARGLGGLHEVALGVTAMIVLLLPLRARAWSEAGARRLADIRATGGLSILAALIAHYAVAPGLPGFSLSRAAASGVMALIAAEAIRERARRPSPFAEVHEALYHLATAIGLWSLALVVPAMRDPRQALVTVSLPAFYFWMRAEIWGSLGSRLTQGYRASAAVVAATVLLLYASRLCFAALLFPGASPETRHYHVHALVIVALGLMLIRLHGLGAPYGIALAGALSVMCGSYFGVTAWPGLSPFESPLRGAWTAVALIHLWTLATAPSSLVTAVLRGFGGLEGDPWHRLRATVGKAALLAAHLLAILAIADGGTSSYAVAPLICGTASLLIHFGWVRRSALYFDLAAVELLAALHADALVPSHVPLVRVLWVLLAARLVLLWARPRVVAAARIDVWGMVCAVLVIAHVLHHRPWSTAGLVGIALLAVITAFVPRATPAAVTVAERLVILALLVVPTWLVLFASAPWGDVGLRAILRTEPLLRTVMAAFVTGVAAQAVGRWGGGRAPDLPRAWHQVRRFLETSGEALLAGVMYASTIASLILMVAHYGRPYRTPELALFLLLLGGLAVTWYQRGRRRGSWVDCFVAEICGGAALALLRRQLLLTTGFWTYEYDLWLSLALSAILTGMKQRLERQPGAHELKRPVVLSIVLLPAFAIFWAVSHHLGADMVLLVVGLNSVLFAFLGRDRRDSPYNLVAVAGFVAFVLIVFWSKLELRVLHAYVVPVGLGVLLLLQLFERDVKPAVQARIRLTTFVLMLGSTAYHALLDERYPVAFNLALLVLCLGCMAMGSLLRIRLYVGLGLALLLLDLASLAVKALLRMESSARMTWVGAAVFLLGALIIGIGVYHKARREELDARLAHWRERLGL